MSLNCPDMARTAIKSMQANKLQPNLDEIAELIELANRIQNPEYVTCHYLSFVGIRAGNSKHVFKPFTIRAGKWFDYIAKLLPTDEQKFIACAYAMEHGDNENISFEKLFHLETATSVLADYQNNLTCNAEELESAISRCMDEVNAGDIARQAKQADSKPVDMQDTIAHLVAVTGLPESHWHNKTSEFCMQVLKHALQQSAGIYENETDSEYVRLSFDFLATKERIESDIKERMENEAQQQQRKGGC